jgi:hypothetical protein
MTNPLSAQGVDDYSFERARQFWQARIREKGEIAHQAYLRAQRDYQAMRRLSLEFKEGQRIAEQSKADSDFRNKQYEEDIATWEAMKAGRHPLGQR